MNHIKHIEFAGVDGARLESFYAELLGWQIERVSAGGFDYGRVASAVGPSAGIRHEPQGRAEIVVYVEVTDVAATVARAEALGARVRIPPRDGGEVFFAVVEDPEGNAIGFTQARAGQE